MIKSTNLEHTYVVGKQIDRALVDININVDGVGFVAVIGATGSGKSTFIQHVNGLLKPTSGIIEVLNTRITSNKKINKKINFKNLRKKVGLVFQFPEQQLFAKTVVEDVMFAPVNFGVNKDDARANAKKTLLSLGFEETVFEKAPFQLSGGQKRKVALAGILVTEPEIVILDEPFAGLDPKSRDELLFILREYQNKNNMLIIIVSHDMDLVWEIAERTIVFDAGEIKYFGSTQDLFQGQDEVRNMYNIALPVELAFAKYIKEVQGKVYE